MQASLRASSPEGAVVGEGKGEDLIGEILTARHQRDHRGFFETPEQVPLLLFFPPPPHPRESLLAGYMQVQKCPKMLTLELVTPLQAGQTNAFYEGPRMP